MVQIFATDFYSTDVKLALSLWSHVPSYKIDICAEMLNVKSNCGMGGAGVKPFFLIFRKNEF